MKNLNLEFNKLYFSTIGDMEFSGSFTGKNNSLTSAKFFPSRDYSNEKGLYTHPFVMKVGYPGLLVGTGYAHEVSSGENDCIKLGFSFDYVTGQPYIPGSSVKGMLRSCFRDHRIVREVVADLFVSTPKNFSAFTDKLSDEYIDGLEKNIFDSDDSDVFFDAVIFSGSKTENGRILGSDYITPHGDDETRSPIPLLMLKLIPGVMLEFRFRLNDFCPEEGPVFSGNCKRHLFVQLLSIFGIGAKTNVGYGALELVKNSANQVYEPTANS